MIATFQRLAATGCIFVWEKFCAKQARNAQTFARPGLVHALAQLLT
jgi:hypothetical protein